MGQTQPPRRQKRQQQQRKRLDKQKQHQQYRNMTMEQKKKQSMEQNKTKDGRKRREQKTRIKQIWYIRIYQYRTQNRKNKYHGRTDEQTHGSSRQERERERDLVTRDKIMVMNGRRIEHETKQR